MCARSAEELNGVMRRLLLARERAREREVAGFCFATKHFQHFSDETNGLRWMLVMEHETMCFDTDGLSRV